MLSSCTVSPQYNTVIPTHIQNFTYVVSLLIAGVSSHLLVVQPQSKENSWRNQKPNLSCGNSVTTLHSNANVFIFWKGLTQSFCSLRWRKKPVFWNDFQTTHLTVYPLRSPLDPPVNRCSWLFKIRRHHAKSCRFHVWLGISHGNLDKIQPVPCPANAPRAKIEMLHLYLLLFFCNKINM